MSSPGSVTHWLQALEGGEQAAFERLWQRYFPRLLSLAASHLSHLPRRVADEHDVVQMAFTDFWQGFRNGQYTQLHDRNDLWRLLCAITAHKARDLRDYLHAAKRGQGAVRGDSAFTSSTNGDGSSVGIESCAVDPEPTPASAAEFLEEYQRLLGLLGSPEVQAVAIWKLEGYENEEIAAKLGCKLRTVERRLKLIRATWEQAGIV
jgi:DNA-directed RNA polymerase specialized sigma24 family protein